MRTEMTAGVGFDKFWDDGGGESILLSSHVRAINTHDLAVTPDEAAASLEQYISRLDMSSSGEYWAPRGPRSVTMLVSLRIEHRLTMYQGHRNS